MTVYYVFVGCCLLDLFNIARSIQLTKKENLPNRGLCGSGRPQSEKQKEKREEYADLAIEQKKNSIGHEGNGHGDTCCNWCTWNDPQSLVKSLGEFEIGEGGAETIC